MPIYSAHLAFTLSSFEYSMTDTKSGLKGKQEKRAVLHEWLKRLPNTDALSSTPLVLL